MQYSYFMNNPYPQKSRISILRMTKCHNYFRRNDCAISVHIPVKKLTVTLEEGDGANGVTISLSGYSSCRTFFMSIAHFRYFFTDSTWRNGLNMCISRPLHVMTQIFKKMLFIIIIVSIHSSSLSSYKSRSADFKVNALCEYSTRILVFILVKWADYIIN